MELLNSKDFNELENFLHTINEKTGFFDSMIISSDGLIILSSNNSSNNMDLESIAAMAANLFSPDSIIEFDFLKEIIINFREKRIFITKLNEITSKEIKSLMFITIIPPNLRYYKRKINKIKDKIKNFFIS